MHTGASTATGDFVELQMFSPGPEPGGGHYVSPMTAATTREHVRSSPSDVANAASQATILVVNDASVTGADFKLRRR